MKKIFLIEDEKILGEMYQERFSKAGFKVCWAREAEEALNLIKKEKPDLIVLDVLLSGGIPRRNGIFFLEQLRKDPKIASIPVIIFSNYDDPETRRQALKLGVKDYLIKTDYTPQRIIERIKKYLE